MDIKPEHSLADYFQDVVGTALKNQGVDASPPTACYLVGLLQDFTKCPPDDEPLALRLAQAAYAPPDERLRQLKEIGDTSLYVSGFFADSLQRKLVDVDYYVKMGGAAYGQLATHFRGHRHSAVFGEIYCELERKFPLLVDVLAEVSESGSAASDAGIVQLYERWLRTGSRWMARRLRQRGVLPRRSELQ